MQINTFPKICREVLFHYANAVACLHLPLQNEYNFKENIRRLNTF